MAWGNYISCTANNGKQTSYTREIVIRIVLGPVEIIHFQTYTDPKCWLQSLHSSCINVWALIHKRSYNTRRPDFNVWQMLMNTSEQIVLGMSDVLTSSVCWLLHLVWSLFIHAFVEWVHMLYVGQLDTTRVRAEWRLVFYTSMDYAQRLSSYIHVSPRRQV